MVLRMARPWPHPVTGIYWFRMAVPAQLRPILKKTEEKCSLRTRDPEQAKLRHAVKAAEVARRWAGLRRGVQTLTFKQATALAGKFYRERIAANENDPGAPEQWENKFKKLKQDGKLIPEKGPDAVGLWLHYRWHAKQYLTDVGIRLDQASFEMFFKAFAAASQMADRHLMRNATGDYSPDPNAARFPQWQEGEAPKVTSIVAAFDAYAKEAELGPRTIKKWRPIIDRLVIHVGKDEIAAVTRARLIDWKDKLLAQGLKARGVRDGYLAAAKATLEYALGQDWIKVNPAVGIKVRVKRASKKREKGFTLAEAETILKATLAEKSPKMSEEMAAARRWIPWICAYTGARVNEITSLHPGDIRTMSGIPVFRIKAENTKTDEYRIVPIYDHLIEQGLLDYVKSRGNRPLFYDPRRSRGGKDANPHYQKVGERLAEWVRGLGIADEVAPNHGWRHRFSSLAMAVGMDERIQNIIQGHAPANEARKYGDLWPRTAYREIQKLPRYEVGAPLVKRLPEIAGDKAKKRSGVRVRARAKPSGRGGEPASA
jgi:integrase